MKLIVLQRKRESSLLKNIALGAIALVGAVTFLRELPALRRYIRMERM